MVRFCQREAVSGYYEVCRFNGAGKRGNWCFVGIGGSRNLYQLCRGTTSISLQAAYGFIQILFTNVPLVFHRPINTFSRRFFFVRKIPINACFAIRENVGGGGRHSIKSFKHHSMPPAASRKGMRLYSH